VCKFPFANSGGELFCIFASMDAQHVNFSFKARYFKLGEITPQTKNIWLVCHGYGQLANYFLKNFNILDNGDNCVIAPEGLSRFYLNGFTGRVGATWMTKEERLSDIENQANYLNTIYQQEIGKNIYNAKITLFGFSQGVATISRWAMQKNLKFNRLVLWAGSIPPDLDFNFGKKKLEHVDTFFVYGNQDPYLDQKQIELQQQNFEKLSLTPTIKTFDGEHAIDAQTLIEINRN